MTIETISSGNNIVGEKYNLTCTVMINGSSDVPSISWNSTVSAETIFHNNAGTYLSVLQFDPLQESHRDLYQCLVKVADITEEELFYLTVQGNSLNIIIIMHDDDHFIFHQTLCSTKNLCNY